MNNAHIIASSKLIADIDPVLARVWLSQPFKRSGLVTAFHRSLSNCSRYSTIADHIAVVLRSAIDTTRQDEVTA
jgi:hypothetical protein